MTEKGTRKKEDGGCAFAFRESGWRNMSVIMMRLSQYISHCDRALPLGGISC